MAMTRPSPPIAVVGLSALFPDSDGPGAFWRNVAGGRDSIREVPPGYWLAQDFYSPEILAPLKIYTTRGGFMPEVAFDPAAFGLPAAILKSTDSIQFLALQVARRLLDDTLSFREGRVDPARTGVVLGMAAATELICEMVAKMQRPVWHKVMREHGLPESLADSICKGIENEYVPWSTSTFPGLLSNVAAGRISNRFGLGGINCVVDAACASSMAALDMAVKSLAEGDSDLVIAGGADALNAEFIFMCFCRSLVMSPTGDCRPFSRDADGTLLGEGVGMLALRRLEDAERDGDAIYAVIRGVGAASDGRCKSVYATTVAGQALALGRAYGKADVGPETVELVEAHGTGTRAGDAVEIAALAQVFAGSGTRVALGSIKSQIGHAKAAAGAAGLCKAILALGHRVYPPTLKVSAPDPDLGIQGTPFYLNTVRRPWIHARPWPRRAGVSAFGFGGSSFHVVLEEYTGPAPRPLRYPTASQALLLFSAGSLPELELALAEAGARVVDQGLWHLARDLQLGFQPGAPSRLALLAASPEEAAAGAARALEHLRRAPGAPLTERGRCWYLPGLAPPSLVCTVPGLGAQQVGMGADPACEFDAALEVWTRAAGLELRLGRRLHDLVFPEPAFTEAEKRAQQESLDRPVAAGPALAAASLAWLAVLGTFGLRPALLEGPGTEDLRNLHAACGLPGGLTCAGIPEGRVAVLYLGPETRPSRAMAASLGAQGLVLALEAGPDRGCLEGLWSALGALSSAGHEVDYASYWLSARPPEEVPGPLGKGAVMIHGYNFGKVYPHLGGDATLAEPGRDPAGSGPGGGNGQAAPLIYN